MTTEGVRRSAERWGPVIAITVALVSAAVPVAGEPSEALEFSLRGEARDTRPLVALVEQFPAEVIEVFEPYERRNVRFRALPFDRVLDAVYGKAWRDEEEFLLTCSDGYQPGFPVKRVLEHRAWLAFERLGDAGFTILKQESGEQRRVSLGPFYLIWQNLDDAVVLQEGDYGWPYQLVGVDLVRARDRFPAMTPPVEAGAKVNAGFAAFRVHCSKCHQMNGEGGTIGPELNVPLNPFEYRERDWLRAWIDDPAKLRPDSRMPAFNPALPGRDERIDEILAYLEAMVGHKAGLAAAESRSGG